MRQHINIREALHAIAEKARSCPRARHALQKAAFTSHIGYFAAVSVEAHGVYAMAAGVAGAFIVVEHLMGD